MVEEQGRHCCNHMKSIRRTSGAQPQEQTDFFERLQATTQLSQCCAAIVAPAERLLPVPRIHTSLQQGSERTTEDASFIATNVL